MSFFKETFPTSHEGSEEGEQIVSVGLFRTAIRERTLLRFSFHRISTAAFHSLLAAQNSSHLSFQSDEDAHSENLSLRKSESSLCAVSSLLMQKYHNLSAPVT
jgi:hypothetical protein